MRGSQYNEEMMDFTLFNPVRHLEATIANIQPLRKLHYASFEHDKLAYYQLYIQISSKNLVFWVKDLRTSQIIWLEEYAWPILGGETSICDNIAVIHQAHEFLKSIKWEAIHLWIDNQSFTHIPIDFFRKEYVHRYLQLAKGQKIPSEEEVCHVPDTTFGLVHVFSTERSLIDWFMTNYPLVDLHIKHLAQRVMQQAYQQAYKLILVVQQESVWLAYHTEEQLLFCNRFGYKDIQDVLYFTLFVYQQLQLDAAEVPLKVYGQIKHGDELWLLLADYITYLALGESTSNTCRFEDFAAYQYIGLD